MQGDELAVHLMLYRLLRARVGDAEHKIEVVRATTGEPHPAVTAKLAGFQETLRRQTRAVIRHLNDHFRQNLAGGRIVISRGVASRGQTFVNEALCAVRAFVTFTAENDPNGEHDFGAFIVSGIRLFWKIDYYDSECRFGSEDPSDPERTTRVLTICLVEEY